MNPFLYRRLTKVSGVEFRPILCEIDVSNGGGTTFECYAVGEYNKGKLKTAGIGLSGVFIGESAFTPSGDTFEGYPVGVYAGGTPAGATGIPTVYVSAGVTSVYPVGAAWSGLVVSDTQVTASIPVAVQTYSHLLVASLLRRSAVTGGLAGWTLVASQKVSANYSATDQWTDVYVKANAGETSLTVNQTAAGRMALSVVGVYSDTGVVGVESYNVGSYSASASPGLHTVPALVSSGDGRLGLCATSCVLSSASAIAYSFASPWTNHVPTPLENTRWQVGTRPLSSGQSITETIGHASHAVNNHDGAEVSVILYPQ